MFGLDSRRTRLAGGKLLLGLVWLGACGGEPAPAEPSPQGHDTPAPVAPAPAVGPPATKAARPIAGDKPGTLAANEREAPASEGPAPSAAAGPAADEAQARALLERWASLQNRRHFDDYAALYGSPFFGVKRSGNRVERYRREGWLADRKKMFRHSMKVEVHDVRVEVSGRSAVIEFDQRWASRSYADRGRKRIVAVATKDGLRIASEMMLASELLRHFKGPGLPAAQFMFALGAGEHTFLVLQSEFNAADEGGPPQLAGDGLVVTATREIDNATVPAALRGFEGKAVQLYSAGGVACKGQLAAPQLMRRVIPPASTRRAWSGQAGGGAAALPPAAVAAEAWKLAGGKPLLVARLAQVIGGCDDALWGRPTETRAPTLYTGATASPGEVDEIQRAVAKLPAYRREQANFKRSEAFDGGQWIASKGALVELHTWRTHNRVFHSFSARAGSDCGDYEGALWALFEVMGRDLWLLTDRKQPGGLRPLAVFDADADGLIEVLVGPELYAPEAGKREGARLLRQRPDRGFDVGQSIEASLLGATCEAEPAGATQAE